ncbi:hypothetical protein P691DRAFT_507014 [Macrolepiota fuliginosa MF-IS2]|uniref:Uncharacterized protein n=1 Tax=Macrolepiota fuliginosa MF-IS2 TaxID=1400762 RepID=A0A9P6C5M7_9AGAR|nr:hypothetical protein P691DRAFT_507014 [Macrolepiota fuliginosa MF-IS2]
MPVNTKFLIASVFLVSTTLVQAYPTPILDIRQWDFQPSVPTNPEGAPLLLPSPSATTTTTAAPISTASVPTTYGITNGPAVVNNGATPNASDDGVTGGSGDGGA